jgi:hypothetical protein
MFSSINTALPSFTAITANPRNLAVGLFAKVGAQGTRVNFGGLLGAGVDFMKQYRPQFTDKSFKGVKC